MAHETATYGATARTAAGWRVPVVLGVVPLCPVCAAPLQPAVTEFVGSLAFCARCANAPRSAVRDAIEAARDPVAAVHLTITRGLRFYTPRRVPAVSLYQFVLEERMRLR